MSKADRRARKRENNYQGRAEREAAAKRAKQRSAVYDIVTNGVPVSVDVDAAA